MVKQVYHITPILICIFSFGACNLEVGNPDAVDSRLGAAQSVSLAMTSSLSCEATAAPCHAAPVLFGDGATSVTFEISSAVFQLAQAALTPNAEENIHTRADLILGTRIEFKAAETATPTGVMLRFDAAANQEPAIELKGKFILRTSFGKIAVPATLKYSGTVIAEAQLSANSSPEALIFNADGWFDFRDAKINLDNMLKALAPGACKTTDAPACDRVGENLGRLIGERIAKSLSVKAKTTQQKAMSKGKTGG